MVLANQRRRKPSGNQFGSENRAGSVDLYGWNLASRPPRDGIRVAGIASVPLSRRKCGASLGRAHRPGTASGLGRHTACSAPKGETRVDGARVTDLCAPSDPPRASRLTRFDCRRAASGLLFPLATRCAGLGKVAPGAGEAARATSQSRLADGCSADPGLHRKAPAQTDHERRTDVARLASCPEPPSQWARKRMGPNRLPHGRGRRAPAPRTQADGGLSRTGFEDDRATNLLTHA